MVQRIGEAAVYLGQRQGDGVIRCRNIGELGAKVVAEAMATSNVTYRLDLDSTNIGNAGAQAVAESLKINRSLRTLSLQSNNIGAAGAKALGEMLKINSSLKKLYLWDNNIGAAGALALAAGLLQNRGLRRLVLSRSGGNVGRQALEDAEKTKKERGEDFDIWWF